VIQRGEEALRGLSAKNLKTVYLIVGDDAWLRESFVARLRDLAVPPEWRDMNSETVWADGTPEAEVADQAQTQPFGSPRRFLLVRGIEVYRGAKAETGEEGAAVKPKKRGRAKPGESALVAYLASPSPGTMLAMTVERWDSRKKWEDDELFIAADKAGTVVACRRPHGEDLRKWVSVSAALLGVKMDPGAIRELIERVGDDTMLLNREMEKLACYAGKESEVTADDVVALTGETAEVNVFHFLDVLFVERKPARALGLLSGLLRDNHPLKLHAILASQLRKIVALKAGLAEGLPAAVVAGRLRLPPYLADQLGMVARRTRPRRFALLLRALSEAEAALKRGRDGRDVLEALVFECCK
jgi:DNA polymerase-3 subunit delta